MKRRIGRFKVSYALLDNNWKDLLPVFARVVPVRAESDYLMSVITYTAFSEGFDEIDEGQETPLYVAHMSKEGDKIKFDNFQREQLA